jgi:protein SCO1/2
MKTNLSLLLASLALAPVSGAAEQPRPACCAAEQPLAPSGMPACCEDKVLAALPATATAKPLAARSIYQLDAAWTNDAGAPVQLATFRGDPVVVTMFFASCEYACPLLVLDMQRIRAALPEDVRAKTRFVLVSFDTARDTPAALKAYRDRMSLDSNWTLLRGDASNVHELAMLLGVKFKQDARGQFAHSNLITILNREGEIAHQRAGLQGDISDAATAVTLAAVTSPLATVPLRP